MLWECALRIDQFNALSRVFFREEAVYGNLCVVRVCVVGFTVSEDKLECFADRVDILWAVMAHGLEVEVLKYVQGLLHHRCLGPSIVAQDLISLERARDRFIEDTRVVGEVIHGENSSNTCGGIDDSLGDRARVKHFLGSL